MAHGRKAKCVMCVMCQRSEETSVTGALLTKDGVTAHQSCLLYSSGLFCRNTPEYDDLFGFSVDDVNDEVNRGSKLYCHRCKKKGATAGCERKSCRKSYHYPCALEDKAEKTDDPTSGLYGLLCSKHCRRPQGGAENDGSDSGMDSFSAVAGTSNYVNGAGSFKRNSSVAGASVCSSGSSSSRTGTYSSPKKRPSSDDRHEMPFKCPRTLSDSASRSEEDEPNTDMNIFAPIESDFADSFNSVSEQQDAESESLLPQEDESCNTRSASSPALPQKNVQAEGSSSQQSPDPHIAGACPARVADSPPCTSVAVSSALPAAIRASFSSSSLSPAAPSFDPKPRVGIDSLRFWKSCNAAGCTRAIFTDFIEMLNDISDRIQTDRASQEDYGLALSVMEASGKLTEFVDKQQRELKRKQTELMKAASALEDVVIAEKMSPVQSAAP